MGRKLRKIYLFLYPIIVVICMIIILIHSFYDNSSNDTWPHSTLETFGSDRYTIEKIETANEGDKWHLCVLDMDYKLGEALGFGIALKGRVNIANYIIAYAEHAPYLYTISNEGYTKLNYETHDIQQTENINEFTEEDQEVFRSLEKRKWIFDFRKSEILQYLGVFCIMFGLIVPFALWIVCIEKESKYKQLKKHQMQPVKNILPVENGTIESASGDHDESSDQP